MPRLENKTEAGSAIYAAIVLQEVSGKPWKMAEILAIQRICRCSTKAAPECPERLLMPLIRRVSSPPTK
jgi:hypothetical protein